MSFHTLSLTLLAFMTLTLLNGCAGQTPPVFQALLTGGVGSYGPFDKNQVIAWPAVAINNGNTYNPATGVFTAPFNGVFQFCISFSTPMGKLGGWIHLQKNGQDVQQTYTKSEGVARLSASNSLLLPVNKGDQVRCVLEAGYALFPDTSSSFSGALTYQT